MDKKQEYELACDEAERWLCGVLSAERGDMPLGPHVVAMTRVMASLIASSSDGDDDVFERLLISAKQNLDEQTRTRAGRPRLQ